MRDELYRDLVDVVTMIRLRAVDSSRPPAPPLADWLRWARGFCAGLYYQRTARRVAQSAWQHAMQTEPTPVLAYAAASAAWAVVHAAEDDELAARLAVRSARAAMDLLGSRPASGAAATPGGAYRRQSLR